MSQIPVPVEINLHRKSRLLVIAFSDGKRFELPCEYLRVFSKAAEVRTLDRPVTGKEQVNIDRLEPQGQYALRIVFDDGHDTGIYSWETLYQLGKNMQANWSDYLARLDEIGYSRQEPEAGAKRIKLLYFAYLVKKLRTETEELEVPESVSDVQSLLAFLRQRRRDAAPLFTEEHLRVTVNKQFAEPFTRLASGDEVALVPNSPVPPPTPHLV